MSELLPCPHIGVDDQGFAVLEWWHGERKLTLYTNDGICLKVWGPNIDSEMEEVDVADPAQVRSAFAWLSGSTTASSPTAEDRSSLFAVYAHNIEFDMTVRIPGYCGTMEEVRRGVMEKAQREGFKGDFVERMAELGWWLEPLVLKNGQAIARQRSALQGDAKLGEES